MNENPKLVPFKIEHLYGNRLENVKRFYIDLDKDVLFERHPQIVLNHYQYWENWHDNPTMDFSDDPTRTVLIDTSKYTEIDIIYQKTSSFIKYWS